MADVSIAVTAAAADFEVIATDGTPYADIATLHAAGKQPFPGLEPQGLYPLYLTVSSDNGSGAAGSTCWFAVNQDTKPSAGIEVFGGDTWTYPGANQRDKILVSNVWLKKKTAGDSVTISAIYG